MLWLNRIKRILSFLLPMHIAHVQTDKNGLVELSFCNGKKLLNTPHANYSYGTLQAILRFVLKKIDAKNITTVLLLGLGGGSVVETLRSEFHHRHKIEAVDFDTRIISLALEEYNLQNDTELEVIQDDAFHFIHTTNHIYNTVIVDLFVDDEAPDFVYSSLFWDDIYAALDSHGSVVFNAAISHSHDTEIQQLLGYLENLFDVDMYDYVESTNTLIIAKKRV